MSTGVAIMTGGGSGGGMGIGGHDVVHHNSHSAYHTPTSTDHSKDERQVAKEALDESLEYARTLCHEFSNAFVAVERRGLTFQTSLAHLLRNLTELNELHVQGLHNELCPSSSEVEEDDKKSLVMDDDDDDADATTAAAATCLKRLSDRHRLRRRTLLQHSTLMELLELSNVMDACIRSQLYDDALHIASIANTLEKRHNLHRLFSSSSGTTGVEGTTGTGGGGGEGRGVLVIANVVDEIRSREVELRHFLIQQFKSDITMPRCLELVTALRRLNGIELERYSSTKKKEELENLHLSMEMRLQVDFLEARDVWLEKTTTGAGGNSTGTSDWTKQSLSSTGTGTSGNRPNDQLLDWIERQRTKGFEIATQFMSIFCSSTDDTISFSSSSNPNAASSSDGPQSLLSIWCSRRIQTFLSQLHEELVRMRETCSSGSGVSSQQLSKRGGNSSSSSGSTSGILSTFHDVMEASMFVATSFGRLGCDFTPLLIEVLEEHIIWVMQTSWNEFVEQFDDTLRICREAAAASSSSNTSSSSSVVMDVLHNSSIVLTDQDREWNIQDSTNTTTTSPFEQSHHEDVATAAPSLILLSPPRYLLKYPPLARLINSFLTSLNDYRRCLMPGTFQMLEHLLRDTILPTLEVILETNVRKLLAPTARIMFSSSGNNNAGAQQQLRQVAPEYITTFQEIVRPFMMESFEIVIGRRSTNKPKEEESTSTNKVEENPNDNDNNEVEDKTMQETINKEENLNEDFVVGKEHTNEVLADDDSDNDKNYSGIENQVNVNEPRSSEEKDDVDDDHDTN